MYEDEIDLRIYVDLLLRYRRFIVAFALLSAVLAFVISSFLPPVYEAQAALVVSPQRSNMTLTSDFVLSEEDLRQVNLNVRADALISIAQSLKTARMVAEARPELVAAWDGKLSTLVNAVDIKTKGDLLVLAVSAGDPELAADLANAWAQVTVEQLDAIYSVDPQTLEEITTQIETARVTYKEAQQALEGFLEESRIPELEGRIRLLETSLRLATENQQLAGLYIQEAFLQQQLTNALSLRTQLETGELSSAEAWGTALAFISLQSQAYGSAIGGQIYGISDSEGELSTPVFSSGGGTPSLLQFDLGTPPPAFTAEDVDQFIAALRGKEAVLQEQIATLIDETEDGDEVIITGDQVAERIQRLAQKLAALQADYEMESAQKLNLTQARDVAWTTYTSLSNKLQELEVENTVSTREAHVAFEAVPPTRASSPRRVMNTAIAGGLGLAFGIFVAFILEYLVPGQLRETWGALGGWLFKASGLPNWHLSAETASSATDSQEGREAS